MTPKERLAAHLLNMYWTGAGDAGTESAIISFRDVIEETSHPLEDALKNGMSTTLHRMNGYSVTMTDHFLMLADKIIEDLNKRKRKPTEEVIARWREEFGSDVAANEIETEHIIDLLARLDR